MNRQTIPDARRRSAGITQPKVCALLAAASALTTVAFSSSALASTPTEPASAPTELEPVTVSTASTAAAMPLQIAVDQGYFDELGLEVTIVPTENISLLPAAVASGQFQFAGTVAPIFLNAVAQNLPIAATAGMQLEDPDNHNVDIIVPGESPLEALSDLPGSTVAAAAVQGNHSLCLQFALEEDGIDRTSVNVQQVPFIDMRSQMEAGLVDAALVGPPLSNALIAQGFRSLGDPCLAIGLPQMGSLLMSPLDWAETHPNEISAMQQALIEAGAWMEENPDLLPQAVADFTGLPMEIAEHYRATEIVGYPSQEDLERWAGVLVDLGVLPAAPDLDGRVFGE